jgi:hypothetical protein
MIWIYDDDTAVDLLVVLLWLPKKEPGHPQRRSGSFVLLTMMDYDLRIAIRAATLAAMGTKGHPRNCCSGPEWRGTTTTSVVGAWIDRMVFPSTSPIRKEVEKMDGPCCDNNIAFSNNDNSGVP